MATKKTAAKRQPAEKKETIKQREARYKAERQMWAVILFAIGVLLGSLTFIEGTSMWRSLHSSLFGVFGFAAYLLAPVFVYIAIITTSDEKHKSITPKILLISLLFFLVCALLQIAGMGIPISNDFLQGMYEVFDAGKALQGGGLLGAILGIPLLKFFGQAGAAIIICLLIFVLIMIITGSTLQQLYHGAVKKPVEKIEQVYSDTVEGLTRHGENSRQAHGRFNIDVPLLDEDSPTRTKSVESQPIEPPEASSSLKSGLEKAMENFYSAEISESKPVVSKVPKPVAEAPIVCAKIPDKLPIPKAEVAVPKEPDNAYIDEIIRRMASKQQPIHTGKVVPPPEIKAPLTPTEEPLVAQPKPVQESSNAEKEYVFPSITMLNEPATKASVDNEELRENAQRLVDTLQSFGVQTRITDISRGPAVTRYELQPSAGVKISKITGLADDIALNLAASGVRIEAPIPGKAAVGIEIPNKDISTVSLREVIDSGAFVEAKSKLTVALGRDIAGNITLADLAKMPHVLIAGSTGSGKSVCINSIIMSILYKSTDKEVKLIMIDPKVVELGVYNGIPHLLVPVVTDPKKAAGALNWAVGEMLKRYKTFAEHNVRDLESFNEMARAHETLPTMPQIVIIIDELSDLMMAAPKDVEDAICRLAQMARAAGMHLVIATQRPSVDVITGIIKANVPSRIAFAVSSQVDSRTILDSGGAEKLLGRGDMLFAPVGSPKPLRVQGCFVSNKEVERVVAFIKNGQSSVYSEDIMQEIERSAPAEKGKGDSDGGGFDDNDDLIMDAIECVVDAGQASTSMIQRRLKVGYARAGRLVDEMEQMGIVGQFEGSKPRQVLISRERWYEMKLQNSK